MMGGYNQQFYEDAGIEYLARIGDQGSYIENLQTVLRDSVGLADQQITGKYDYEMWYNMIYAQSIMKEFIPELDVTGNVDMLTNQVLYNLANGQEYKKPISDTNLLEAYKEGLKYDPTQDDTKLISPQEWWQQYSALSSGEKAAMWSYVAGGLTPNTTEEIAETIALKGLKLKGLKNLVKVNPVNPEKVAKMTEALENVKKFTAKSFGYLKGKIKQNDGFIRIKPSKVKLNPEPEANKSGSLIKVVGEAEKALKGAKGLIGKDFEEFLTKKLGGNGSFSKGGRDFDGGKLS